MIATACAALSVLLGALTWSFSEYALHNWCGHHPKGKTRFSKEHLQHHSNGTYFASPLTKALVALAALAIVTPLALWCVGPVYGLSYAASFSLAYMFYEWLHRRCHTHPPRSRYGAWVRHHHLHHHYTRPKENHGVTSPLWDIVFATHTPQAVVRVPARKTFEVPWLVDENNEVRAEFADTYSVATPRRQQALGS